LDVGDRSDLQEAPPRRICVPVPQFCVPGSPNFTPRRAGMPPYLICRWCTASWRLKRPRKPALVCTAANLA